MTGRAYTDEDVSIYEMDALEMLRSMPEDSVDAVITDPPYGTTDNGWDIAPDWNELLDESMRVSKGAVCIFSQMPVAAEIVMADRRHFRYQLVWEKNMPAGFLWANKRPMRAHEVILVFSETGDITYNPQMRLGYKPYKRAERKGQSNANYGKKDYTYTARESDGERFPIDVLQFNSAVSPIHPTQKPVPLIRWLIRTFTNEGGGVADPYMGSGSTAVAAIEEGRHAIGSELTPEYFDALTKRLNDTPRQSRLPIGI